MQIILIGDLYVCSSKDTDHEKGSDLICHTCERCKVFFPVWCNWCGVPGTYTKYITPSVLLDGASLMDALCFVIARIE